MSSQSFCPPNLGKCLTSHIEKVVSNPKNVDSIPEKVLGRAKRPRSSGLFLLKICFFKEKLYLCSR